MMPTDGKPIWALAAAVIAWLLVLATVFGIKWAFAQQQPNAVSTYPLPGTTLNGGASTTIASSPVYQQLWAANVSRHGCLVVNAGTHTMTITEGVSTTGSLTTTAGPFPILPNGSFTCQFGQTVLTGQVNIGGTAGDQFYAAQF